MSQGDEKQTKRKRKVCVFCLLGVVILVGILYSLQMSYQWLKAGNVNITRKNSSTESGFVRDGTSKNSIEAQEKVRQSDWRLVVVNRWHPISETYKISLTQLRNNQPVDERCYPDLQAMMDDCRRAGLSPLICSSYRTWEKQTLLYQNKVAQLIREGYPEAEAKKEASTSNAIPGTSEHQLGLAVDIVDNSNQRLDETQEDTAVQKWLLENSWKYGFILRYPAGKSEITGIIYEPWHYRYVGKEAAKEIYEQRICLEEYLGMT